MTYKVRVAWDQGADSGKITAYVQAPTLEAASVIAVKEVRAMRGPGPSIVAATNVDECSETIVLIPDGEKPRWLSRERRKDLKGQQELAAPVAAPV